MQKKKGKKKNQKFEISLSKCCWSLKPTSDIVPRPHRSLTIGSPTEYVKQAQFPWFFYSTVGTQQDSILGQKCFSLPLKSYQSRWFSTESILHSKKHCVLLVLSSSRGSFSWPDIIFIPVYLVLWYWWWWWFLFSICLWLILNFTLRIAG